MAVSNVLGWNDEPQNICGNVNVALRKAATECFHISLLVLSLEVEKGHTYTQTITISLGLS